MSHTICGCHSHDTHNRFSVDPQILKSKSSSLDLLKMIAHSIKSLPFLFSFPPLSINLHKGQTLCYKTHAMREVQGRLDPLCGSNVGSLALHFCKRLIPLLDRVTLKSHDNNLTITPSLHKKPKFLMIGTIWDFKETSKHLPYKKFGSVFFFLIINSDIHKLLIE